jgi:hypothetical protein
MGILEFTGSPSVDGADVYFMAPTNDTQTYKKMVRSYSTGSQSLTLRLVGGGGATYTLPSAACRTIYVSQSGVFADNS